MQITPPDHGVNRERARVYSLRGCKISRNDGGIMKELFLQLLKLSVVVTALTFIQSGGAVAKTVSPDFIELAKKLKPSVVNISTAKTIAPQKRLSAPLILLASRILLRISSTGFLTTPPSTPINSEASAPASLSATRGLSSPITMWWPAPTRSR